MNPEIEGSTVYCTPDTKNVQHVGASTRTTAWAMPFVHAFAMMAISSNATTPPTELSLAPHRVGFYLPKTGVLFCQQPAKKKDSLSTVIFLGWG